MRVTAKLLSAGARRHLISLNEHNEEARIEAVRRSRRGPGTAGRDAAAEDPVRVPSKRRSRRVIG